MEASACGRTSKHSKSERPLLVCGAGISGLTSAILFRLVFDKEVIVFDKVSKIEAAGSGMSLIGHSLLLLRDIGIDIDGGEWQFRSKCAGNNENPANDQANSTQIDRDETAGQVADSLPMPLGLRQNDVSLRRSDGTIVLQTPTESGDQFIVGAFGSVQYNCHRGELQQALLRRAIQVGVVVRTGERVQGIRQWLGSKDVEGWVEVLLEKGVYVEGCAVIGADGVHSVVRESLRRGSFRKDWTQHGHGIDHEDNEKDKKKKAKANMSTRVDEEEIVYEGGAAVPTLRYCGYSCWRGLTSDTSCFTSAREHPVMYKTVAHEGGGQVSFTVGRMPRGRVFWVCDIGYGERQENPEDIHKFIVQAVGKGACGEIEKVIRSTPASAIVRTNIHETTYHPRVHIGIGRVALIGDAAHAMVHHFGQGACMAIEDSFRLAMCYEKALLAAKSGIEMKGLPFCGKGGNNVWVVAVGEYDSWRWKWRPFLLALFSRLSGEMYMYNSTLWNAILVHVLFGWPLVLFIVYLLRLLVFYAASDLREWSKNRLR